MVAEGREDIAGMSDLGGTRLAVEFGSEGDMTARTWAGRLSGLEVVPCQDAATALGMVQRGAADAALVDHVSALGSAGIQVVGPPVTSEPYGVAVRRRDGRLLRAVNAALDEMRADGTLGEIEQRWLGR